jgi:hypothetical protein
MGATMPQQSIIPSSERIAELEREVANLRAALRPFAAFSARKNWQDLSDDCPLGIRPNREFSLITVGDCRRAQRLLVAK